MTGLIETIRTMCPMNRHPTLCGMLVDVRDGELLAVRGDKDKPRQPGLSVCARAGLAPDHRQPETATEAANLRSAAPRIPQPLPGWPSRAFEGFPDFPLGLLGMSNLCTFVDRLFLQGAIVCPSSKSFALLMATRKRRFGEASWPSISKPGLSGCLCR